MSLSNLQFRNRSEFLHLYLCIKAHGIRYIISIQADRIQVWYTVRCKAEKIHQGILWPSGMPVHHKTSFFLSYVALHRAQRLLDPPGCAYRSETGGLMEALRVLSVEQSTVLMFAIFLGLTLVSSTEISCHVLCPAQFDPHCWRKAFQWHLVTVGRSAKQSGACSHLAWTKQGTSTVGLEAALR